MPALTAAVLIVLLEALSFGAFLPVLSYYCQEVGGNPAWVGGLFALVSAPRVFSNPLFGRLSDRLGRRPVLVVNTLGTLSGSVLWALTPTLAQLGPALFWLAVSRAVTGIFGAQAAITQAIAADSSTPQKRAAAVGMLGAAFGIALTLGPAIGGTIGHHISNAAVGWVCAGMQACSLIVILFFLPETRGPAHVAATAAGVENAGQPGWPTAAEAEAALEESRPRVQRLLLTTLLMTLAFSHLNSAFPLLAEHVYHFTEQQTGYALGLMGVLAALVQGGLVRVLVARFAEPNTFIAGILLAAFAFVLFALTGLLPGFWVAIVTLGIGISLATPTLNGLISRNVNAAQQGRILGLNQGVTSLGRAGGAMLAGTLFTLHAATPFLSAASLLLVTLAVFVARPRWAAPREPAASPER